MYAALNKKLRSCQRSWMEGFLEEGGLQVLLHGVESLSGRRVVQLTDAMLLLECVACVKSVMNSTVGLQLITHSRDDVNILVKGTLEPVCEWMRGVSGVDPPVLQLITPPPARVISGPPGGGGPRNPLCGHLGTLKLELGIEPNPNRTGTLILKEPNRTRTAVQKRSR